ncbi:MAG: peptide ABC transporter substrate-binding protein [Pseudomonadales bacterium]|nr:peptide ABC transporter substrate-binding protein [Pseudomonadales bacterium]
MPIIRPISALLAMLCLVTSSLAGAQSNDDAVDFASQTIHLALTQEPPQLNSMKATDQVSILVLSHVMEGLVRYDRRGNIVPGVAERWELTPKKATFWLRKNAFWSDGQPVTAHDFVFAWRNALDPATASEYAFILYPIKNAEAINKGKLPTTDLAARALDDYTLEIDLESPTPYFLKLAAFVTYYPVRQDFFEAKGDGYAADTDDLLYNGPFVMTEWTHSASLKMVKNQRYWDKEHIVLNAINADYITADTRARLNLYIDGKIVYTRLDGETYKDALTQRFRIRSFTTGSVFFMEYNHRDGRVTRNANLRRAIQHVFDPDEFVNKVLATPGNLPGESLFPVWLQGVDGRFRQEYPAPRAKVDVDEAKAYLQKAATELGRKQIPPLVLLVSDSPTATKQAEYMQGLLKSRLGLDIKIDVQTFKQRLAKMTAGDFDMVGAGWGPDYDDIMTFGDLFASWNLNNRGRYSNPEYDRLVRVGMTNTDPKTRMDAMGELQQILFDQAVILPQYEQGVIYLMHPKLRGVVRRVVGADPDFTYARVIE